MGDFLYPLINTYRNFNQRSVYTAYQNSELISLSRNIDFTQQLLKKLELRLTIESNFIDAAEVENVLYMFYQGGFDYQLPGKITLQVYVTNKVTNLDTHFQTFYQSQRPIFGFSITRLAGLS